MAPMPITPTLVTRTPFPRSDGPLLLNDLCRYGENVRIRASVNTDVMPAKVLTPLEERVNRALDRIRPAIFADGGDVWLIRVENETAFVQMLGACGGCSAAHLTLKNGIEAVIREDCPEITAVEAI